MSNLLHDALDWASRFRRRPRPCVWGGHPDRDRWIASPEDLERAELERRFAERARRFEHLSVTLGVSSGELAQGLAHASRELERAMRPVREQMAALQRRSGRLGVTLADAVAAAEADRRRRLARGQAELERVRQAFEANR